MKPYIIIIIISCFIMFAGCKQHRQRAKINTGNLKTGENCYEAIFNKDIASLKITVSKYGVVTGKLSVIYSDIKPGATEAEIDTGSVKEGEFKGDTLFANYTFTSGTKYKTLYTNPIALLHKGDTLIFGQGRVMSYLGRNYFDPETPINFNRSRFRFVPVDCK